MALKEVVESNEYMIDEERATLNNLVEAFFPLLESVMGELLNMNPPSPNKTLIEHLISKIFYSANNLVVTPYFLAHPPRITSWMHFFESVLARPLGQALETPTDSSQ